MLFEEMFPIQISIILLVSIVVIVFSWRFYTFRIRPNAEIYKLPSIVVVGPRTTGKTSIVKKLTGLDSPSHIVDGKLSYSSYLGPKRLQFIDSHFPVGKINKNNVGELKRLNSRSLLYIFDVSPTSLDMESQINGYQKLTNIFGDTRVIPVANKLEIKDNKKMKTLKSRVKHIKKVYFSREDGLDELKSSIYSSK